MAKLAGDARYCLLTEPDPGTAVAKLNNVLTKHLEAMDRFITFSAAFLNPTDHSVSLVNAGHLNPLLYRRSNHSVEEVACKDTGGLPLGIMEGQTYTARQISLEIGDCLLFYTDGVTDAANAQGVPFGNRSPWLALQNGGPYSASALGECVVKAVRRHVAGHTRFDDVTLVCVGRTESS